MEEKLRQADGVEERGESRLERRSGTRERDGHGPDGKEKPRKRHGKYGERQGGEEKEKSSDEGDPRQEEGKQWRYQRGKLKKEDVQAERRQSRGMARKAKKSHSSRGDPGKTQQPETLDSRRGELRPAAGAGEAPRKKQGREGE